jgi:hypothetical protein
MHSAGLLRKATVLGAVFFLLSAESTVAQESPGAENLVAHHATYVLSLAPDNKNSQITGAEGLMVYDLKNVCDGWATDLKLKFVMSLDSGDNRDFETSQVTWEAKDGSAFRYLIKNSYGGGEADQLRGEARIDAAAGGKGTATADLPARAEAELPAGVLFPVAHTRALLKKAAEGETVFTTEFFDGTSSTEAMEASAIIGAGEKDWPDLPKKLPELAGKTSYPIGLAFFAGNKGDGVPDTEQVERLYDNGVIGAFSFQLGTVKIRAVLDSLQLKPDAGC